MNKYKLITFIIFIALSSKAQESLKFTGSYTSNVFLTSEDLPFWAYTNTDGFLNSQTDIGISAYSKISYDINENHQVQLGAGILARNGFQRDIQRSDLYIEYSNNIFNIILGARRNVSTKYDLSSVNGNILNTGNTRSLPGVLLENSDPFFFGNNFFVNAGLGHYRLNDERSTLETNVHYKNIEFGWEFKNKNVVTVGLKHYVQWGGIRETGEVLPSNFKALTQVFFGSNATGINNPNETINALGNHLGTYNISYKASRNNIDFELYHQTLFDDRSGRELNNFPDGVWGAYITFKKTHFIKGVLYEYVQTVSQSGRPVATGGIEEQQSGGDNYFINGVYPSGWTYEGQTIGLPFINPINSDENPENNRSIAHHFGIFASIDKINIKGKLTYLQNLGTYRRPFENRQKQILSYLEAEYITQNWGSITLYSGIDILNDASNNYGIGIGYSYNLK